MKRLSDGCLWLGNGIIFVCMSTMAVVICAQVFARYVLHHSIPWSEELGRYLMIWLALTGAGVAFRKGANVAITLILDKLAPRPRAWMQILGKIVMGIFLAVLIRQGIGLVTFFSMQKSPAMRISMAWPYASMFVAGLFMMIHLIYLMIGDIQSAFGTVKGKVSSKPSVGAEGMRWKS